MRRAGAKEGFDGADRKAVGPPSSSGPTASSTGWCECCKMDYLANQAVVDRGLKVGEAHKAELVTVPCSGEFIPCSNPQGYCNSQAGVSLISNGFRENAWRRAIFRDVGWGNMSQRMDDSPARDSRPGHRAAARD